MRPKALLLLLSVLAAAVGITWVQAPAASACSCAVSTVAEQADFADVVGSGTVRRVTPPSDRWSSAAEATYLIDLDAVWKGPPEAEVRMLSAVSSASCGLEGIVQGDRIILFANGSEPLAANLCGGTWLFDDDTAAELTALLGEPTAPTPAPASGGESDLTMWSVVVALILGAGAAAGAARYVLDR